MKKLLLILAGLLFLTGCGQQIPKPLALKAPLGKIVSYKVVKEAKIIQIPLLGGKGTFVSPTGSVFDIPVTTSVQLVDVVHYRFVSNDVATHTPYFDKNNFGNVSNAEVLPKRKDGISPIAFYADPVFYRTQDGSFNIEEATTTLVAFNEQTQPTLADKFRGLFMNTALATSTFNSSSTLSVGSTTSFQYLIIGGGGGASGNQSGGAGAGGYLTGTTTVGANTYTVIIGQGGVGQLADTGVYHQGVSSSIFGFTARGGGGGGQTNLPANDGQIGGSGGGGGAGSCGSGGTGTQGSNGGAGWCSNPPFSGGGGGGACYVGGNAGNGVVGNGGDGCSNSITGVSTTYAGGGAGCGNASTLTGGTGGLGGGVEVVEQ